MGGFSLLSGFFFGGGGEGVGGLLGLGGNWGSGGLGVGNIPDEVMIKAVINGSLRQFLKGRQTHHPPTPPMNQHRCQTGGPVLVGGCLPLGPSHTLFETGHLERTQSQHTATAQQHS